MIETSLKTISLGLTTVALSLTLASPASAVRGGATAPAPEPWSRSGLDLGERTSSETGDRPAFSLFRSDSTAERLKAVLEKIDAMYGIDWYRTRTSGNLARAFRPSSTFQLHNATIGYKDRYGEVDADIQTALRWTNDNSITRTRDYKMMSFAAQFDRKDAWRLRFGDIFPNFSPYTFSRSARTGVHGYYNLPLWSGQFRVTGAAGVTNREQEFTGGSEAGQYRRWASGGSLAWEGADGPGPLGKLQVSLQAASSHDDGSSIRSRRSSGGTLIPRLDVDVYSFRYEAGLPAGFTWRGENAYSDGNRDRTRPVLQRYGTAHNTALDWFRPSAWGAPAGLRRLLPVRFRADYEWVDPDFLTDLGSASVDQLRWGTSSDFRWNENLDWTVSHLRNEDNVTERATTSVEPIININRTSSIRMNMRPLALLGLSSLPENLRQLRYTTEFRYNNRDASNNSANQKIEDYSHSLDHRIAGINLGADYKWQLRDDDINALTDRRMSEWGLRVSRPITWSIWEVRLTPSLGYRNSVDRTLRGENLTKTQSTNFGLGIGFGEFLIQTGYTITDVDRNLRAADALTRQFTGSFGFRPVFIPDLNMTFSFRHQHAEEENPGNSYKEIETKAHVDYRF